MNQIALSILLLFDLLPLFIFGAIILILFYI